MQEFDYFQTNILPLSGSDYSKIYKNVKNIFKIISFKTHRKPYIRSKFFGKRKIFFDYFWPHLFEKPLQQRLNRLKYVECGLALIRNTNLPPTGKVVTKNSEVLFRFYGVTKAKNVFVVQIKQTKKNALQLISIYPK